MKTILLAWIGKTDLRAPKEEAEIGLGPIAQALAFRHFDEVLLVTDYPRSEVTPYVNWLKERTNTPLRVAFEKLSGPTQFGEIYEAAVRACQVALSDRSHDTKLTFHLSPGTPAMAAVWIILGKTKFPAELIESSRQRGVVSASFPFDISADFVPDLLKAQDERIRRASGEPPPEAPEFADIIYRSRSMGRIIGRARQVAVHDVPVLVEGESGTGKELLARAIHRASLRGSRPFLAVNCGAIPQELVESQLFGHEKGAFTGAAQTHKGYFEAADGGTLFLDELGELPRSAQVKLLRVIQEGEIVRLGSTRPLKVNVRIIAATNRSLNEEVTSGRFREDLFYRLVVAALKLPPLRERSEDLGLLIDWLLDKINAEYKGQIGYESKKLSVGARNLLLEHPWPGNVRELSNTLRRALIWSDGQTLTAEDIRDALLQFSSLTTGEILNRPLGKGLDIQQLLGDVARHYLQRAMDESGGNKTRAAELIGLPSYQTLTNWLTRYKLS